MWLLLRVVVVAVKVVDVKVVDVVAAADFSLARQASRPIVANYDLVFSLPNFCLRRPLGNSPGLMFIGLFFFTTQIT